MTAELAPDRETIQQFVAAMFKHADPNGIISLRLFRDKGAKNEKPISIEGIPVGDSQLIDTVLERAGQAAVFPEPAVFCPPVATFKTHKSATGENLLEGVALSVECDAAPENALATLTGILGEPTMTVASGGEYMCRETGEVQPKLHLHWRLKQPYRGPERGALYQAREIATKLVGADETNISIVHPIRWPGSWHRKKTPARMATIRSSSENEIDLQEALDALREAAGADVAWGAGAERKPNDGLRSANDAWVAEALGIIPNENLEWKAWNNIGMATYAATGGSVAGRDAFASWSAKSAKNAAAATLARWEHYRTSPPRRVGFGTLVYLVRQYRWGWAPWADTQGKGAGGAREARYKAQPNDVVTEDSAANMFVERYGKDLRYCHSTGSWFRWNDRTWVKEQTGLAFHWARTLARQLAEDQDANKRIKLNSTNFASGVEKFAKFDPDIAVTIDYWDADPMLLGTPGGTVDLHTGRLRPPSRDNGITKITGFAPSTDGCPLWLTFLDQTTGADAELIRFLRQWCGYSLTGLTREHALVFVYGPGGNGKSVFMNTVATIFKDYATTAAMDTFTASYGDRHPTDLAMLRGARLVTASETEEGRAWAESRIKQLTGGDRISARFMRQDFFEFVPQFKLTIVGNHKPVLRNVDEAARRRFLIVPFERKPDKPDRQLEQKLIGEAPGILQWMIEGCLDWQQNGLLKPASVLAATEEYFSDQDLFAHWLAEECDCDAGNVDRSEMSSRLFSSWRDFAVTAGNPPGSRQSFADQMTRHGFKYYRSRQAREFFGIRLRVKPSFHDAA
jgi:putative DNA primase/helicase